MNKTIRCVAIDDEPLALDVIAKFCERIGNVELSTFSDPTEGLEFIKRTRPDIAFLDIEMENINGLTIASQLPTGTCFIFTTAYLNYALEGFNLDAVDYLHKPFPYARFETAFQKAIRRVEYNRTSTAGQPRSITVKQEYSNVTIPLDDILYIEAMEGYSKIFRQSGKCVISRVILKNICALLPEKDFLRIHRSYVVPVSKIKTYTRQELTLSSGISLPIGRQYSSDVIAVLKS
ncbi:MAG: LytTR family DNA-binding domain-containing protein [Duncaniella sp.]|nr:LytTR family DNA-binding domain-containing protein [Duncaniella sp.]